jgi:chromate transporter
VVALFARFLRFGLLAFGGPVAQIAMLRRELVDEEQWVSGDRFNRLLAAYQALPGPEAHELAVHLGMLRGGRLGGLLAGLGFMLPGFVLVVATAALYGSIDLRAPLVAAGLLGVQVAVVALIARAVHGIGRHVLTDVVPWAIAIAAAAATLAGVPFWVVLPVAGLAAAASGRGTPLRRGVIFGTAAVTLGAVVWLVVASAGVPGQPSASVTIAPVDAVPETLAASGLKAGLLTFGGAYTAIPFVRADAVGGGWVTDPQFLDALALSGILPTPLIMFAAFVGYLAGGLGGAVAMTIGIFLPAFAFALVLGDRIEALVARPGLHRILEGIAAAVVGIIAVTALELGATVAARAPSLSSAIAIGLASLVVLWRWRSRVAVPLTLAAAGFAGMVLFGRAA